MESGEQGSRELMYSGGPAEGESAWLWLLGELQAKRDYLAQTLQNSRTWEECCRAQGALAALQGLLAQINGLSGDGPEQRR